MSNITTNGNSTLTWNNLIKLHHDLLEFSKSVASDGCVITDDCYNIINFNDFINLRLKNIHISSVAGEQKSKIIFVKKWHLEACIQQAFENDVICALKITPKEILSNSICSSLALNNNNQRRTILMIICYIHLTKFLYYLKSFIVILFKKISFLSFDRRAPSSSILFSNLIFSVSSNWKYSFVGRKTAVNLWKSLVSNLNP